MVRRPPHRRAFIALLAASCCLSAAAQESSGLDVLYIGSRGEERTAAFVDFLRQHFDRVVSAEREGFDPRRADAFDVVLLDWSQSEIDYERGGMAALVSPLGERDQWSKPTVLLGSAGLLLAAPWQTQGSYG